MDPDMKKKVNMLKAEAAAMKDHFSDIIRLGFVAAFPNLAEDDGRVKPVEDGQRHGDVGNNNPRPQTVKVQLDGINIGSALLQSKSTDIRNIAMN